MDGSVEQTRVFGRHAAESTSADECPGFSASLCPLYIASLKLKHSVGTVSIDRGKIRDARDIFSTSCIGKRKKKGKVRCDKCAKLRQALIKREKKLRSLLKPCEGISRAPYEQILADKERPGNRTETLSCTIGPEAIFSQNCLKFAPTGGKVDQKTCDTCRKYKVCVLDVLMHRWQRRDQNRALDAAACSLDNEGVLGSLMFEAQRVEELKFDQDGQPLYRVRWHDTWEPEDNLLDCEEELRQFREKEKSPSASAGHVRRIVLDAQQIVPPPSDDAFVVNYEEVPFAADNLAADAHYGSELSVVDATVDVSTDDPREALFEKVQVREPSSTRRLKKPAVPGRLVKCKYCDYTSKKAQVKLHEGVHTRDQTFPCEQCGMLFTRAQNVHRHIQTVHMGIPRKFNHLWKCRICSATFKDKYYLKLHVAKHEAGAPCRRCPHCPFYGRNFQIVERHIAKVHVGEKRFACEVCERKFWIEQDLMQHKKSNPHEFLCLYCSLHYSSRSNLWRHVKMMHENEEVKPYRCDPCNMNFGAKYVLQQHLLKYHPGEVFEFEGDEPPKKRKQAARRKDSNMRSKDGEGEDDDSCGSERLNNVVSPTDYVT